MALDCGASLRMASLPPLTAAHPPLHKHSAKRANSPRSSSLNSNRNDGCDDICLTGPSAFISAEPPTLSNNSHARHLGLSVRLDMTASMRAARTMLCRPKWDRQHT